MTVGDVMSRLENAGSAATRRTYARHGITRPTFGTSYALADAIGRADHGDTACVTPNADAYIAKIRARKKG